MNTVEQTIAVQEEVKEVAAAAAASEQVAVAAPAPASNVITLSPQDRTRVMSAIGFHVNGHSIPKLNTNGVTTYERVHGEEFLNNFFKYNMQLINQLGQLPSFSFFRTIQRDLVGKEVTLLLINGLLVKGYLGANKYDPTVVFDPTKPAGLIEGTDQVNSALKTFAFVKMTDNGVEVIEEIPFINIVAVNDRLPLEQIPAIDKAVYEAVPVPLIKDEARNRKIIDKQHEQAAAKKAHDAYASERRKKNAAVRKARRANRK